MSRHQTSPAIAVPPDIEDVRCALGAGRPACPPAAVTQEPFDHNDSHLRLLSDPGAEVGDCEAAEYAADLRYMPIQRELLSYAFPRVLPLWRRGLWTSSQERLPDELHATLCHVELPLNEREWGAVHRYMAGALLERMDAVDVLNEDTRNESLEHLFDYLSMTGVYMPDIRPLWESWWALETRGRARVAMQWASILRYDDKENPLWRPWTPKEGGGPPRIWMESGWVFNVGWRGENADYIRSVFTADWLTERVRAAVALLAGTPDDSLASQVAREFGEFPEIIAHRLSELPALLARKNEAWGGQGFSA